MYEIPSLQLFTVLKFGKSSLRIFHAQIFQVFKTGQMSIHPSVQYQHFLNPKARLNHWADINDMRRVYSMGLGTQLLGSGILNFGPARRKATPNLARLGEMTYPK